MTINIVITQALTQCPNTLLVLSGYSQGSQLVHNAADLISSDVTDFVAAGKYCFKTPITRKELNERALSNAVTLGN